MTQYKYYFKKPKSEIVKDILKWLVVGGAVCIAATSPCFVMNLMRGMRKSKKYDKKRVYNTFYKLKKQGCIEITEKNNQIYISLTQKGKKKAGRFQIDSLEIKKPKKWDGKWSLVIFDIAQLKRIKREALRGKLKEMGFRQLQKSIWAHPYQCKDEISLLKDFFGLANKEIRLVVAQDIGDDIFLRRLFKL